MSDVSITINGRTYDIGCDAGQENHVVELASYVDYKLQQIARSGGAMNETHLMVLTLLMLANETFEAKGQVQQAQQQLSQAAKAAPKTATSAAAGANALTKDDELALVKVLENVAKRIEGIANKLQAA